MGRSEVSVFGFYGKKNVGDESYKLSFPLLFPQHKFTFGNQPVNAKATILGGGDIVSTRNLDLLRRCEGRKYIMSATIRPDVRKEDYDGLDGVLVRDYTSLSRMRDAGIPAQLVPDFAFALQPNAKRGRMLIGEQFGKEGMEQYEKVVVVVLNGHLSVPQSNTAAQINTTEKLAYDVARIADTTSASFLFLPFGTSSPNDDRVLNAWSCQKAKWFQKNAVIHEHLGVQDALDVIAAADAVLSMRLHSSIFAAVAGTPFIDITHNHKNPELLRILELESWGIPYESFDHLRCRELLGSMLDDPGARKRIRAIGQSQAQTLRQVISHVRVV